MLSLSQVKQRAPNTICSFPGLKDVLLNRNRVQVTKGADASSLPTNDQPHKLPRDEGDQPLSRGCVLSRLQAAKVSDTKPSSTGRAGIS